MNKHKCGSCRFFQEARLAGSGWCHHPQRRTTSDVMIMVRRNELACRDEWSHDLWAPIDAGTGGKAGETTGAAALDRFPERPEPPATPAEIAAVVQAPTAPSAVGVGGRVHEDVVVGETLVIGESERDWTWHSEDPAASRVVDTRAAIIKARETYRDRAKTLTGGRPTERALLSPEHDGRSLAEAAAPPDEPANPLGSPPPAETSQPARPPEPSLRLSRTAAATDDDEVPSVDPGFDLSHVTRRTNGAEARLGGEGEGPARAETGAASLDRLPSPAPDVPEAEPPVALSSVRRLEESGRACGDDRRRAGDRRPPEPSLVPVALERTASTPPYRTAVAEAVPELVLPAERREEATTLIHGRRGPFRYDPPPVPAREVAGRWGTVADDDDEPQVADEADRAAMGSATVESVPVLAGGSPVEDVVVPTRLGDLDQPVDLTIRVAPDLPRTCRMCRDYRPAEGGGRGWCANEWAFTHRRVVDPDERMPCETSLGSWWLPVDAIWLARTDVSSHGQPTPILDAVVAHHQAEPLQRRGS